MRVAIVGGSVGGLTAALLLRDAGHEVRVLERSPTPLVGAGAGMLAFDETVRYIAERTDLRVDDLVVERSRVRHLDAAGNRIHEAPQAYRFTSWDSIARGLERAFDGDALQLGRDCIGVEQDADGVDVLLADGSAERADLAVLADGAFSQSRKRLFGVDVEYAGYVAWRAVCTRDTLPAGVWDELAEGFTYGLIGGSHALAYPIPVADGLDVRDAETRMNALWYRPVPAGETYDALFTDRSGVLRHSSVAAEAVDPRHVAEMRAAADRLLAPPFAAVMQSAAQPFLTAIVDADVPAMRTGRVCLLGDAAVLARPHPAAGAAKAARDAWALAAALDGATAADAPAALQCWEATVLEPNRAVLARGRAMGARLQGPLGAWDPDGPLARLGLPVPG